MIIDADEDWATTHSRPIQTTIYRCSRGSMKQTRIALMLSIMAFVAIAFALFQFFDTKTNNKPTTPHNNTLINQQETPPSPATPNVQKNDPKNTPPDRKTHTRNKKPQRSLLGKDTQNVPLPLKHLIRHGDLLASEENLVGHSDIVERTSIFRTDFKYPYIRVSERLLYDDQHQEQILSVNAMVADHLIVKVQEGTDETALSQLASQYNGTVSKAMYAKNMYIVELEDHNIDTVTMAIQSLQQEANQIAYSEPDYLVFAELTPDDPMYDQLWGMNNTGQTSGTPDADIDAPEAWNLLTTSHVVVAVIDTGVDYTHPDLADNIWINPAENPTNNIDDDGNGFIDDYRGWDFCYDDNNPQDGHNHGTHVSGTIGGRGNNSTGVVGVCWIVNIMPVKFLSDEGSGTTADAIDAVTYAATMGANIMNNSWGGGGFSQGLMDAITLAHSNESLFVAAAGNSSTDNDVSHITPPIMMCPMSYQ